MARKDKKRAKITAKPKGTPPLPKSINNAQRNVARKSPSDLRLTNQSPIKNDVTNEITTKSGKTKFVKWWQQTKAITLLIYAGVGVITTLTGKTIYEVFQPQVEIITTASLNKRFPYQNVFEIKNNSYLSMTNTFVSLAAHHVYTNVGNHIQTVYYTIDNAVDSTINGKQSAPFVYDISKSIYFEPDYVVQAEVALVVNYKYLFKQRQDLFFYRCILGSSNEYVWVKEQEKDWINDFKKWLNRDYEKGKPSLSTD